MESDNTLDFSKKGNSKTSSQVRTAKLRVTCPQIQVQPGAGGWLPEHRVSPPQLTCGCQQEASALTEWSP